MNKTIYTYKLLLLFLVILTQQTIAQTSTSWTGETSTSWNLASNWTNGIPDSSKDVYIGDANFTGTFQPKIATVASCNSITVGEVVSATLSVSQSIKVFSNLKIMSNGIINHTTGNLFLKGNWYNNGDYQTTTSSKVVMYGTSQTIAGNNSTLFRKLTINASTVLTLTKDIFVSGTGNLLTVTGELNPGMSPSYLTTAGTIAVTRTGKLKVNKATFADNYSITSLSLYAGSTIDYASTVTNQTISSSYAYSTLMISGSGTKSLVANLPALYSRAADAGKIIVNGGTFDMSTFTASRGTSIAGGEMTMANGAVLKIAGNSNFPKNFASVNFAANSLTDYYGANQIISNVAYGNLLIEGSGTKSATQSFSVAGDLTIQSSIINTASNTMTVSIKGGFIMNGGSITGTNATYELNGSSNQSVNLLSDLYNVKINKTGGAVNLTSNMNIATNLNFVSGVINTNSDTVSMLTSATITGAAHSTGWVNGNLKKHVNAGSSVSKAFEIGSATHYSPTSVQFASVSTAGDLTATLISTDHPELDYSGINPEKSVNEYWSFNNDGVGFTTASITFEWNAADVDAGADVNSFLSGKYGSTTWSKYAVSSEVANSIVVSNVTALEEFAIGQKITEYHWTGADYTTDWYTPKNWYGGVPDSSSNVTIPNPLSGRRNYPILSSSQSAKVNNLVIQSRGSLIVDDATIQINGNASNSGVFDVTNGTAEFNGRSSQTVASGLFTGNKLKNLVVNSELTLADVDSLTGYLSIAEGKTLYTNDNLTLKSDASGTARIAPLPCDVTGRSTAIIVGRINIERYIPARKAWRLLSAPVKSESAPTICGAWQESAYGSSLMNAVSNPNPTQHYGVHITGGTTQNGFDQSVANLPSVKFYNPTTNTFSGLPSTPGTLRPITDYTGYMIYVRGDRGIDLSMGTAAAITSTTLRIKGEVRTGNQDVPVNAQNFTVFGNPFASPIDFATLTKNNVKNSFYIWDPKLSGSQGLGAYVTVSYNSGTGTYDVTTASSPISQYIPSGEAILIESADGTRAGTITVKESDKVSGVSDMLFGRNNSNTKSLRVNLYSQDADGTYSLLDGSMTSYHDNNSNSFDIDDIKKLSAAGESIAFSRTGHTLAIERKKTITSNDTSFINLSQTKKQNYRLDIITENLTAANLVAVVKDNYAATTNNLPVNLNGSTYVDFTVNNDPASFAADRFSIVFMTNTKSETNKTVTPVEKAVVKPTLIASTTVYPNPVVSNDINVKFNNMETGNYNLKLYNITGQLIATQSVKYSSKDAGVTMKVENGFVAGKYELKIEGNGKSINTSILKQ